ncbi:MAG: glycosyltransferase family 4 protein [Polyangia bacterium]
MGRPRVAIVTNIIPHYRADFYRRVLSSSEFDCHVYCQGSLSGERIETSEGDFPGRVTITKGIAAAGQRIAWQQIPIAAIRRTFDLCFVYGNPRVLSNLTTSLILLASGLPVVIWGQAHAFGSAPHLEAMRLAWWRLFRYLFVYTDEEVAYLRTRGFSRQVILGMNNGLDQSRIEAASARWTPERLKDWRSQMGLDGKTVVLSCARLLPRNRFDLVVDALPALVTANPNLVWSVLGGGPEQKNLERQASARGVSKAIRWNGPLHDEDRLAPWFLSSAVLVHPGAIGLTLLHAFGYGLPVVTHDERARHGPEIAALEDGQSGVLFRYGDVDSLRGTIAGILGAPTRRATLGQGALATARERFNTARMAERFTEMVRMVLAPKRGTSDA